MYVTFKNERTYVHTETVWIDFEDGQFNEEKRRSIMDAFMTWLDLYDNVRGELVEHQAQWHVDNGSQAGGIAFPNGGSK